MIRREIMIHAARELHITIRRQDVVLDQICETDGVHDGGGVFLAS